MVGINYAPEIIAIGVYTTGLVEHLARLGAEIDVITARPYYPAWRTFDGWRRPGWTSRVSDDGARIVHCPIYVPANPTGGRRILHHMSYALSALPVLLWKALTRRPDVVLLVAPSLILAPAVLAAARMGRATSWVHVQDFEVEAAFATGLMRPDSRAGRFAQWFEAVVLRRFDRASSISAPMLERLRGKGVAAHRVAEFRNWADLDRVVPLEEASPLKAELGIGTRHVALYSGNLANKQGLEILPLLARALSHRTDLTIAIFGEGPMRARLQAMAADLPMVRFFPLQPVERLGDLMGLADVHLLPQVAGVADLMLPSKLTNMLASGRPVVATALPGTALAQEVEDCGRLVPPGDVAGMARAVEELLDDPETRARLGRAARQRAEDRCDRTVILSRMLARLEALRARG